MGKRISFALSLLCVLTFTFARSANALEFDSTFLRLNNQAANQTVNATFCAKPSSATLDSENQIIVSFPSTFIISSNNSNWITSTNNLPTGATAWPGISANAINVSGKSVTFLSSDLALDVLYCFNIASALSNNGPTINHQTGTITTKNTSNATIDSTTYALSVLGKNQIQITASIDPQIADLPVAISADTPGVNFAQDTTLNYTITYGLNTVAGLPVTIRAIWSEGTIEGDPSPSIEILNYVVGSASNGYGGTTPVVDTVNRTITWTISSLPGGTSGQTVTFSLKTNSNYTGANDVSFDVMANLTSGATTTPNETVTQTYKYNPPPSVLNLPGDGKSDGRSDGRSDGGSSSPIPAVQLYFNDIYIHSLSQSKAEIAVITSLNSKLTIKYGFSPNNLSSSIKTLGFAKQALLVLPDLKPSTDYFFTITATDELGKSITSDIFTIKTAVTSPIPSINVKTLLVTSNDNILLNPFLTNQADGNFIVIPQDTDFTIQFTLEKTVDLKKIQAIVRNANVLGFNTTSNGPTAKKNFVDLVEVRPGIYTGKIASANPGNYELYVRLFDFNGNILEEKVSDLNVTNKITIYKKGTNKQPVENVRMLLYLYNPTTKIYELISPNVLPIQNPSFSDPNGTYTLVLPYGQYKADISTLGYKPQTLFFQIQRYTGGYPTIYLEEEPFNLINSAHYFYDAFNDAVSASQTYLKQQTDSNRLFNLMAFGVILLFIVLTAMSISARTHVEFLYLPFFLIYRLIFIFKRNHPRMLFGKVVEDETNLAISRATIYLKTFDGNTVAKLKTNRLGEFYYRNKKGLDFKITIAKKGFIQEKPYEFKNGIITQIPSTLIVKREGELHHSLLEIIWVYTEDILGLFMESILLFGLILQVYFVFTFGFLKLAPFITLTIFNLVLIFTFLYKPKGLEE